MRISFFLLIMSLGSSAFGREYFTVDIANWITYAELMNTQKPIPVAGPKFGKIVFSDDGMNVIYWPEISNPSIVLRDVFSISMNRRDRLKLVFQQDVFSRLFRDLLDLGPLVPNPMGLFANPKMTLKTQNLWERSKKLTHLHALTSAVSSVELDVIHGGNSCPFKVSGENQISSEKYSEADEVLSVVWATGCIRQVNQ